MSLLHNHQHKYKCPCGKGHYTVNIYNDKSGPVDEHWKMNCIHCKQSYQLSSILKKTKYGVNESYVWTPISIFGDLAFAEGQLHKAENDLMSMARELYLEKWILYFSGARTKREIWNRMTDNGQREPDFYLFDQMVYEYNLSEYLERYFQYHNLEHILKKLNVRDMRLEDMKNKIHSLEYNVDQIKKMMKIEGFVSRNELAA
jgi:hypothetical protein